MGPTMASEPSDVIQLQRRIEGGDEAALIELFARYRDRLKRMVQLRLDQRLKGRIDASDVLQEAFLDVQKKAADFAAKADFPPYLWLRLVTAERLLILHRHHLGARRADDVQHIRCGGLLLARFVKFSSKLPNWLT